MRSPTLVILAAGLSRRYGEPKSLLAVGPSGETLIDYAIYDALRAGFGHVVVVTNPELDASLSSSLRDRWRRPHSIQTVIQSLTDLPGGVAAFPNRTKPWGTGHAVLAARAVLDGPFAVVNCDDFYGGQAYRAVADHLRTASTHALVGFPLEGTLSAAGGVSRALCHIRTDGTLARLTELRDVSRRDRTITGTDPAGRSVRLRGDETISLNCWGFHRSAIPHLMDAFERFLTSEHVLTAEFLLSAAVDALIGHGRIAVSVLPIPGSWFGMTFPGDRAGVVTAIQSLVEAGEYPADVARAPLGP